MRSLLAGLCVVLVGCATTVSGPINSEVAVAPGQPAPTSPPPADDPFEVTPPVRDEPLPVLKPPVISPAKTILGPAPKGLPPAPAVCAAFVARRPAAACAKGDAMAALADALAEPDAARRDQRLTDLEPCAGLPVGVARALRGELAPTACGEALHEAMLKKTPADITPGVYHAILGQAVASRLARAGTTPPALAPPYEKARVLAFTKGPLLGWFAEQAKVVQDVSAAAAELPYYAQAITAIEAGMADMRLVEAVRAAPIPDEFAKDTELKNAYFASLDQGLDPRKDRGRDAALVGLKQFAIVGSLDDPRVKNARSMLSRLYGGRHMDALDALPLAPLGLAAPASTEEKLASLLPTFYASILLDDKSAMRPGTMGQFAAHGVPLPMRMVLAKAELTPELRALYARARLDAGRLYWRALDFDQAAALLAGWPKGTPMPDETRLTFATALALRNGPDDAADMMRKATRSAALPPNVAALDALAKGDSKVAGNAAFNAALALIFTPQGAAAAYFQDLAARFRKASERVGEPMKTEALTRAKADEDIAGAIK